MDIGNALKESYSFAWDTIWQQWKRWCLLTIMSVLFPFILGYMMEIYRGNSTPPEAENWKKLFVDGLKLLVAAFIYAIPVFIILIAAFLPVMLSIMGSLAAGGEFNIRPEALLPFLVPVLGGLLLSFIVGIIIAFISSIGIIRMARTDSFSEAFNISGILQTIRSIGWGSYILAVIVLWIIIFIVSMLFFAIEEIPYIGWIIGLFLGVPLTVYEARYMTLLYESAEV